MAEKEMRNFALRDENANEIGVFTGKSPRQAALKAANRVSPLSLRVEARRSCHIHGREGAGGQPRRAGLDARQDLEARGQEGGPEGGALKLT